MTVLITLLLMVASAAPAGQATNLATLHCRIEIVTGAESQHCEVTAPRGRKIRPCGEPEQQAGHCDKEEGRGRYVAWVVGTGPGHCRITDKRTSWKRGVVSAKLSKSVGAPSTCDLYVELR